MAGLFGNLFYVEELRKILEEEEELIREWDSEWSGFTSKVQQASHWGPELTAHGNRFLGEIWDDMRALNTELRKLEEMRKLSIRREEELPRREKRALRQLRKKLDWEPLKQKKKIESYIRTVEHGNWIVKSLDEEKYKKLLNQVIGNEIEFWKHLFQEKEKIEAKIKEEKKIIEKLKRIAEKFLARMADNNPNWWVRLHDYFDTRKFQKYICATGESWRRIDRHFSREELAQMFKEDKEVFKVSLNGVISRCNRITKFFKRVDRLLGDIETRLKRIKP